MVSFAGDNVDKLLITGDAELFESLEPSEVDQVKDTGHELVVFLGSFDSCHKEQSLDAVVTELSGEQAVLVAVAGPQLKMSLLCQFLMTCMFNLKRSPPRSPQSFKSTLLWLIPRFNLTRSK